MSSPKPPVLSKAFPRKCLQTRMLLNCNKKTTLNPTFQRALPITGIFLRITFINVQIALSGSSSDYENHMGELWNFFFFFL